MHEAHRQAQDKERQVTSDPLLGGYAEISTKLHALTRLSSDLLFLIIQQDIFAIDLYSAQ